MEKIREILFGTLLFVYCLLIIPASEILACNFITNNAILVIAVIVIAMIHSIVVQYAFETDARMGAVALIFSIAMAAGYWLHGALNETLMGYIIL